MKKVLIITYYWPPSGGAGVQRWVKFAKYLREFGWEPIIYTPLNPGFSITDQTLLRDIPAGITVLKTPIWEPYEAYRRLMGKKTAPSITDHAAAKKSTTSLLHKLSVWVRGNLFIPDARKYWINPSVKFLKKYLAENSVDVIVSTGPPHSMHLIALQLTRTQKIPWVADFRDPWTDIDYYKEMNISAFADRIHKKLELKTITSCDTLVVVGREMKANYEALGATNVKLITNGFDPHDMDVDDLVMDSKFSISHIGTLPPSFNMVHLWQVLAELAEADPEFKRNLEIKLVGKVQSAVLDDLKSYGLFDHLNAMGYVSHNAVPRIMKQSAVLALIINRDSPNSTGILTGKIFEYMASGRPILALGPVQGDLAKILNETAAGTIAETNDYEGIKTNILNLYQKYCDKKLDSSPSAVTKYTRQNLTKELANVLNQLVD